MWLLLLTSAPAFAGVDLSELLPQGALCLAVDNFVDLTLHPRTVVKLGTIGVGVLGENVSCDEREGCGWLPISFSGFSSRIDAIEGHYALDWACSGNRQVRLDCLNTRCVPTLSMGFDPATTPPLHTLGTMPAAERAWFDALVLGAPSAWLAPGAVDPLIAQLRADVVSLARTCESFPCRNAPSAGDIPADGWEVTRAGPAGSYGVSLELRNERHARQAKVACSADTRDGGDTEGIGCVVELTRLGAAPRLGATGSRFVDVSPWGDGAISWSVNDDLSIGVSGGMWSRSGVAAVGWPAGGR